MHPTQPRYGSPTSSGGYLLLTISDQASGNTETIIIHNQQWMEYAKAASVPTASHEAYVDYMITHEDSAFVVPPAIYAKLANYQALEADPAIMAMTNEQILDKYFDRVKRSYILRDNSLRQNSAFLRALLEKKAIITENSYSGELKVNFVR